MTNAVKVSQASEDTDRFRVNDGTRSNNVLLKRSDCEGDSQRCQVVWFSHYLDTSAKGMAQISNSLVNVRGAASAGTSLVVSDMLRTYWQHLTGGGIWMMKCNL